MPLSLPKAARIVDLHNFPTITLAKQTNKRSKQLLTNYLLKKHIPDDGAVILWDSIDINIDEKSRYIYSTRRVAKIFNEDGRDLAEVSIPYMRGRDDVTIHHARTLTPDGKIVELDTDEIIRDVLPPSAVDAGLHVDARLMYFTLPKVSDGCIIDYAYSTNNLGHVMRGEFWRQVYFQGEQPVQYYRFTVHIPKKKQLYYQVSGAPAASTDAQSGSSFLDIKPTMTENNYTRTYIFEARDVPPLKDEYLMPAPQDPCLYHQHLLPRFLG